MSTIVTTGATSGIGLVAAQALLSQPGTGRTYASLRKGNLTWPNPSDLSQNDQMAVRLRVESLALVT